MNSSLRDLIGRVRSAAERHVRLTVRSRSGAEGFVLIGGHRPRHYFSRLYLGEQAQGVGVSFDGGDVVRSSRRLLREYGLVVFCGDSLPPGLAGDVIDAPAWVDLVMPMPPTLDRPLAQWRGIGNDIRRVRREGFSYEVEAGDAWVAAFHRHFHRPSIVGRYGVEAYVLSERALRDYARTPGTEFVRVLRGGEWVGGALTRSTSDGYRLHVIGWRRGDEQLVKSGVVSAIYWSCIQRASELRHPAINFGAAAPHLEDGLLFYKGRWGGRIAPLAGKYGTSHLLVDPAHETCRRFLAAHSLLARGSNGDVVVFSARRPDETGAPSAILDGVTRWYRWRWPPDEAGQVTCAEVPARLRPWLVEEPVQA